MAKVYKHPISGYTYSVNEVGLVRVDDPTTGPLRRVRRQRRLVRG